MQFHGQMYIIGDSKYEKNEKEQQVESYQTVYRGGMGEIIEKKSRFIAEVYPIEKNIGMQDITAGHMFLEEIQLLRE